jgi:hypothetical protein
VHLFTPQFLQIAFTICGGTGGYLPTFNSKEEFEALFYAFKGSLKKT